MQNEMMPGLGLAKSALQHKLNKQQGPAGTDNKHINQQISNLKKLIDEAESNNSRSIVQQVKILEEKVDDKIQKAIKSIESRFDEVQESIFGLQSASMGITPQNQPSHELEQIDLDLLAVKQKLSEQQ